MGLSHGHGGTLCSQGLLSEFWVQTQRIELVRGGWFFFHQFRLTAPCLQPEDAQLFSSQGWQLSIDRGWGPVQCVLCLFHILTIPLFHDWGKSQHLQKVTYLPKSEALSSRLCLLSGERNKSSWNINPKEKKSGMFFEFGRYLWKLRLGSSQLLVQEHPAWVRKRPFNGGGQGRQELWEGAGLRYSGNSVTHSRWPSRSPTGHRQDHPGKELPHHWGGAGNSCAASPKHTSLFLQVPSIWGGVMPAWHAAFSLCSWKGFPGFLRTISTVRHVLLF